MACESCGDKPKKCNKDFTKAVIEIDNPEQITLMRKVTIPASMGDDTTVPPAVGKYKNVLLNYEANNKTYLYSSDGIPTQLNNGVTDYEAAVNLPQINGHTLLGNKTAEQLGLQDKLTAGEGVSIDANNVLDVNISDGLKLDDNNSIYAIKHVFDNVPDMKEATDLVNGDYVQTLGFHALNDGGGAIYKISTIGTANEMDVIAVGNLYASLVPINDCIYTKQFGVVGDGVMDDTVEMQTFFNYDASNYVVNSLNNLVDGNIVLNSNSYIFFNDGCSISRKTNSLETYFMFLIDGKHDITIDGAHLIGDRETHSGNSGEWGHGINIVCSNNITVKNSHIEYTWGDGVYVGLYTTSGSTNEVKNITIDNCHINNCSRNGISVCSGSNISIKDCFIEYTDRTWPKAGIDIEPEGPSGSTPAINGLAIDSIKTSYNTDGILVTSPTALVNGLVIDNQYSIYDKTAFAISRFGNSGNTLLYKNAYIELAGNIPIAISKENTNMITIKDIICDSTTRTDTPNDYYGLVNINNSTDEDFGGIVFDNIQGVENHTGNNYQMYTNVICRNNSTSGKIVNIILKNTNDIITTRTPRRLMYLYGTNYDFSTIKIINCNNEVSSNYYQLNFTRGCNMKKLKASSLGDNSTVNVTDVLADGIYEVELLNRNSYRQEVIFDSSYNVYHGDGSITTLDYRKMQTTANGSYLKFEKKGQDIMVLVNNGYTPMQVS